MSERAERQFNRILRNHQSISSFTIKTPIKETGPKWANYDISGNLIHFQFIIHFLRISR